MTRRKKSFGGLLCIVGLMSLTLGACATTSRSENKLSRSDKFQLQMQMANGAIKAGDPTGALQILQLAEKIANSDLERGQVEHERAIAFFAKKESEAALASARKAAGYLPNSPEVQNNLGRMLLDAGIFSEAETWLSRAAGNQLYREAYSSTTNLGVLHYRKGDDKKAAQFLNKAVQQAPATACLAYYYLGHLELKAGHFNDAVKNYDKATQRFCASFVDAHLALGVAFTRNKQYDKARRKFIEIKDSFPETAAAEQAMERLRSLP